jgi:hypothetical protein
MTFVWAKKTESQRRKFFREGRETDLYTGADFSGADMLYSVFSYKNLSYANFQKARLNYAQFQRCSMGASSFEAAQLRGVVILNSSMVQSFLTDADMTGGTALNTDFSMSEMVNMNLTGANLTGSDLSCVDLRRSDLTSANLSRVNFQGALLRDVKMADYRLEHLICQTTDIHQNFTTAFWANRAVSKRKRERVIVVCRGEFFGTLDELSKMGDFLSPVVSFVRSMAEQLERELQDE